MKFANACRRRKNKSRNGSDKLPFCFTVRSAVALIVSMGLCCPALATTYYVSARGGDDAKSGLSTGEAWKSIARVNRTAFRPGDKIRLRRGEIWPETLRPSSSGSPGNVITFGAYATGPKPIITGSDPSQDNAGNGSKIPARDYNIDNNEQSHILYEDLDLQHARQGLRIYAWTKGICDITLRNSIVTPEQRVGKGTAGVYASAHSSTISDITVANSVFRPNPTGLENWGVYLVQGVSGFRIVDNELGSAGEDAITIWHSQDGLIAHNRGGGNGENTIDVKDSHDIVIRDNSGDGDGEYNIVVHSVDSDQLTYNVTLKENVCRRGGQQGELTAGIALLCTRRVRVIGNVVEQAYGPGIFDNDRGQPSRNEILQNRLAGNGTNQTTGSITLEDVADVRVTGNTVRAQGSNGFALVVQGTRRAAPVILSGNTFFPGTNRVIFLAPPGEHAVLADKNLYYSSLGTAVFRVDQQEFSFEAWQIRTGQDARSRLLPPEAIPAPFSLSQPH